jgi:uncharacterized BrkB/YihY/UPF0761 family membrane protein
VRVLSEIWTLLGYTVLSFLEDEALTRAAAIAFYAVTSIAPVLLIVVAIAGLVFAQDAAENAIIAQLSDLMGRQKPPKWCRALWQVQPASPPAPLPRSSESSR